jgi:CheY-like chemotaxis protein
MSDPCILIVEQDLLVRTPLAEYLRECGYLVLEASSAGDARTLLEDGSRRIDIVLAEVKSGEPSGFALASWVRTHLPNTQIVLAGTIATAAEKAGGICQEDPRSQSLMTTASCWIISNISSPEKRRIACPSLLASRGGPGRARALPVFPRPIGPRIPLERPSGRAMIE